jgi:hypothetical protein
MKKEIKHFNFALRYFTSLFNRHFENKWPGDFTGLPKGDYYIEGEFDQWIEKKFNMKKWWDYGNRFFAMSPEKKPILLKELNKLIESCRQELKSI